jgi:hypothetical protein
VKNEESRSFKLDRHVTYLGLIASLSECTG